MNKFDLGFGNSIAVRQAFLESANNDMIVTTDSKLSGFDYPPYLGDPEVIKITREVIKRYTGNEYRHIIMTNGATGAINIALNTYRMMGFSTCITRDPPYYLRYPTMVKASGLNHRHQSENVDYQRSVVLLDYPSNPLNICNAISSNGNMPTILDGVYLSNVYMNKLPALPVHDIFISSYSKLTGLNGLRVGFIATDNDPLFERLKEYTIAAYCGLSRSDAELVKHLLHNFNWDRFEYTAKKYLNYNREEWAKLEKYFGYAPVQGEGMFYYGPMDNACKALMEKSGVTWTTGESLGVDNSYGRFNIGQDCNLIKEAVAAILKNDRR